MSAAIQAMLREPKSVMAADMGLGSREQTMSARPAKRERFILSEQEPASPQR